jgi:predicted TPR repeat methyltransferase
VTTRVGGENRDEAGRLCDEGYASLERREFAMAQVLLEKARALEPDNAKIHYILGLLFSDQGRAREALSAFDASLRLNPDDHKAHNNRGSMLQILGRLAEAEAAFRRALDLRPDLEQPYVNLGKLLEQQGKVAMAIAIYDLAISRGLDAGLFGQHRATAAGVSTSRSPDRWVVATFDNFAPTFDAHLKELHYQVPRELAALLQPRAGGPLAILDLGCGTGLVGAALAEQGQGQGHRLTGVDLSPKMLAQAGARNVYQELRLDEIHASLRKIDAEQFDVVFAADVLIYIGALEELFREAARVLRTGGAFLFSTEECESQDYRLLATGRYAQSRAYIERLAEAAFDVVEARATTIRMESGVPLPGRLYMLNKR